jgi:pimeloyl-ACP methyl ester carboxylesterase
MAEPARMEMANFSRRSFLTTAAAVTGLGSVAAQRTAARGAIVRTDVSSLPPYGNGTIPAGIRARQIANVNGMTVHILETGYEMPGRPAVLLLHGFPELAYSWRKVMLPLAAAGYHVIAPDQRGYGRTIGWDDSYDADPDYYQNYQRTRGANDDMLHAPQGLHAFFRAYYFYKSADYEGNHPHPLKARTAEEMAKVPTYYVMEKDKGMAATVAPFMPSADQIARCKWLTEAEVAVYAAEYGRTGFTGALQGYRVRRGSDPKSIAEMHTFSGRTIDVPSQYIGGKSDWGVYQTPGAVDKMRTTACTRMVGFHLVDGAGHWIQQEQPESVSALLVQFLRDYVKP